MSRKTKQNLDRARSGELRSGESDASHDTDKQDVRADQAASKKEINGPKGLEPTRYGDWESKGRCVDF